MRRCILGIFVLVMVFVNSLLHATETNSFANFKSDTLIIGSDTLYIATPVTERNLADMAMLGQGYANQIIDTLKVITFFYDLLPSMDRFSKLSTIQQIDAEIADIESNQNKKLNKIGAILPNYIVRFVTENKKGFSQSTANKLEKLANLVNHITQVFHKDFMTQYLKYKAQLVFLYEYDSDEIGLSEKKPTKEKMKPDKKQSKVSDSAIVGEISKVVDNYAVVDVTFTTVKVYEGMTLRVYDSQYLFDSTIPALCNVEVIKIQSSKIAVKAKGNSERKPLKVGQLIVITTTK